MFGREDDDASVGGQYATVMTPKLSSEQRQALTAHPGRAVAVVDDETRARYALVPWDVFERVRALLVDGSESALPATYPLLDQSFGGPEGWDAPGLEASDDYDSHRQP